MEETTYSRFVDYLIELADSKNRGALAALRRGLGCKPGEVPEMFPYVIPFLPENPSKELENAYYLIASLFALHPVNTNGGNMGNHLASCIRTEDDRAAIERRFIVLLNSHVDDLGDSLRQSISFLKSKEMPVNYKQLLNDLLHWSHPEHYVQRNWARGFWGSRKEAVIADDSASALNNN
ncbi:MAG TPA: type I-E CRISPR-associated protein Cse2/CasB [Dysgonamonadaceae bacterium]|nr:type I-E CRISPR-associated protein Cse2/CasB [Dysgonamonadaceae bacterium]